MVDPGLRAIAERGARYNAQDVIVAQARRVELGTAVARFHERYDLLLTPQMPLEVFEAGRDVPAGRDIHLSFNLTMQPACR